MNLLAARAFAKVESATVWTMIRIGRIEIRSRSIQAD